MVWDNRSERPVFKMQSRSSSGCDGWASDTACAPLPPAIAAVTGQVFECPPRFPYFAAIMRTHFDAAEVGRLIQQLADRVNTDYPPARGPIVVIGIRTRGEVLADRLAELLKKSGHANIGRGVLDITLYRDDLSEIGPRPTVRPTRIDVDINGKPLVLIDDVLFTGRTVRAGLDALADFGRPSAIRLAVLVDRGGRELPIQPDYVAVVERDVPATHKVKVELVERDGVDAIRIMSRETTHD
jgi:pyrimidine operon attenuation protein/uracil phosphoribosyltransferase